MWNWFSYFLTMMMALMLVAAGSVCGCTHAHAAGVGHDSSSELKAGGERMSCSCSHGESSEDEEPTCQCGCDVVGEHDRTGSEPLGVAVATNHELDGFELPELGPRFRALLVVWFADFLEPCLARESQAVAHYVDPGPPGVDVPIYLQVQNLRL